MHTKLYTRPNQCYPAEWKHGVYKWIVSEGGGGGGDEREREMLWLLMQVQHSCYMIVYEEAQMYVLMAKGGAMSPYPPLGETLQGYVMLTGV